MISLDLNRPAFNEPTEEQLRKRLADAVKARSLLNNREFQWWVGELRKGAEREYKKLVYREDGPVAYHRRRGTIQGIEKSLEELRLLASVVENIEAQIKERHDRQSEPVARGA